jgi:hypothetical protein
MRRETEARGSFLAQTYTRAATGLALPSHSTFHVFHHSSPTGSLKWQ